MARVVRARARDDGRAVADLVERRGVELEALVVGERRALPGRAGDDEAVGAVVDEVARERAEAVQVERAVPLERRHDRGQHFAEHRWILLARWPPARHRVLTVRAACAEQSLLRPRRSRSGPATSAAVAGSLEAPVRRGRAYKQRVEPDRQARRQRRELLEREQHAGHERLPRGRVVPDRQRLTRPAEDHLLVRDEARQPDGVDRRAVPAAAPRSPSRSPRARRASSRGAARRSRRAASPCPPRRRSASSAPRRGRSSARRRPAARARGRARRRAPGRSPSSRSRTGTPASRHARTLSSTASGPREVDGGVRARRPTRRARARPPRAPGRAPSRPCRSCRAGRPSCGACARRAPG